MTKSLKKLAFDLLLISIIFTALILLLPSLIKSIPTSNALSYSKKESFLAVTGFLFFVTSFCFLLRLYFYKKKYHIKDKVTINSTAKIKPIAVKTEPMIIKAGSFKKIDNYSLSINFDDDKQNLLINFGSGLLVHTKDKTTTNLIFAELTAIDESENNLTLSFYSKFFNGNLSVPLPKVKQVSQAVALIKEMAENNKRYFPQKHEKLHQQRYGNIPEKHLKYAGLK